MDLIRVRILYASVTFELVVMDRLSLNLLNISLYIYREINKKFIKCQSRANGFSLIVRLKNQDPVVILVIINSNFFLWVLFYNLIYNKLIINLSKN